MPTPWEFWIDVGGTFTDCLAQGPEGEQLHHKLLSSAVTKGTAVADSTTREIIDPQRIGDPDNFWVGFTLQLINAKGNPVATSHVTGFDSTTGRLTLSPPFARAPSAGTSYELISALDAPLLAIRFLLGLPLTEEVPPVKLRLGTTRGTNALLTRTGARTALAITRGFGDLLEIGSQERPDIFALTVHKNPPLTESSVEIEERVAADGTVLVAPDEAQIQTQLIELHAQGFESLAICLLHADLYPEHELVVERIAREVGFAEISRSSDVAPLVKIVPRAETTVVDAYLNPVLREYVERLHAALPGSQLRMMTSAGGLVSGSAFRGHSCVLSGPAGGVVGYAAVARRAGFSRAIGFDMGGTSTDVSRYDGSLEFEYETRKAGVRLVTPTLAISTVAAGGGSICSFDGTKLIVGPESAGADPGPACYGRGGPLTVTDLNFFLGRIATDKFPFHLDRAAVELRLAELSHKIRQATAESLTPSELAEGLLKIANANMVRAIRGVSIAKGANPADYVLVAFGGAAAQHACAIASELEMKQILYHPDSSILSAYGIGQAEVVRHAVCGMSCLLSAADAKSLETHYSELTQAPLSELQEEGFPVDHLEIRRTINLRYQGTDAPLNVLFGSPQHARSEFERQHQQQFGYIPEDREIEITALRVEVVGKTAATAPESNRVDPVFVETKQRTNCYFAGKSQQVPRFDREKLAPGSRLAGPALIADSLSSIFVESDWQVDVLSGGELLLTHAEKPAKSKKADTAPTAVQLEIFNNLFAGIAEQMGHVLRRTSLSVNVKERLDFSCAVFTARGELVANAPHMPVHLGAMGATVRAILAENPEISPGDVFATNDPYRGGSHLPDITVVTPVHDPRSKSLLFFTACRAHHAEIGGIRPGSMPPSATTLGEEGVLISNFALVRNGRSREEELRNLLTAPPYPSRRVEENLADIRAQVAANQQGARDLLALVERYTLPIVREKMQAIQEAAETKVRLALRPFGAEVRTFTDYLELEYGQVLTITAKLTLQPKSTGPAAIIDFTGSSDVVTGNLNANPAIVSAAVLYVLRLLVKEDLPLNEGALRAVKVVLPPGLLNPPPSRDPSQSPAVAAGNVETSQRVVDVLLGALGIAGASQGTMNNLLFGTAAFGYYETICGGSGATADGAGASAVQVHMTNTRATDPEIFERRHPVRLQEFSVRRGSGGAGKHEGGDGVVRKIEFLIALDVSLISQRRGHHPPYGTAGGKPGLCGKNTLIHNTGHVEHLPGICELGVEPGDTLILETPGGGGFGEP